MKVILTESQIRLIRRISEIESLFYPTMESVYQFLQGEDPSPLMYKDYDIFHNVTKQKITNLITKDAKFNHEEKEHLKTQILSYIEDNYASKIKEYFDERRKNHNVTESTHDLKFKRRYDEIEELVNDFLLGIKLNAMDSFDSLLGELTWDVANKVVSRINIPEDDYVMYRNQLIRFIKNNFYSYVKEFWDRNNYWDNTVNESYDKRMVQRRYGLIKSFINGFMIPDFVCAFNDPIDFVDRIMDRTADHIFMEMGLSWDDDDEVKVDFYQDIYDFISENFIDDIYEYYENERHNCEDDDGNWVN